MENAGSAARVVRKNVLQRSWRRSKRGPVATIESLVSPVRIAPLVPRGSLVPEGLDGVEIRGFPGGVNPESDANGRADQQTQHHAFRLVASAGAAFGPIPGFLFP